MKIPGKESVHEYVPNYLKELQKLTTIHDFLRGSAMDFSERIAELSKR